MKAFPYEESINTTDPYAINPIRHPGMDLRDYFAAQAMQAYFNGVCTAYANGNCSREAADPARIAKNAYRVANAMMEAREK